MISRELYLEVKEKALTYFDKAGIILTDEEKENLEIADFGLNNLYSEGLELITYVNTERCCAKELVLLPHQTCPEHRHPPLGDYHGKEETFRCRYGEVYLYVQGEPAKNPACKAPELSKDYYTVWHEIHLTPGMQYTLHPNTLHWFQAGPQGAVVSEFSTKSLDELDVFTNPAINRIPEVED